MRPGWADAQANRTLAQARADAFAHLQGEQADDAKATPDEVYRRNRQRDGSPSTDAPAGGAMTDEAIRSLWLRRVQTRPADFLRARFAYQLEQAQP
jgi:Ca-activated chloride channel family protein